MNKEDATQALYAVKAELIERHFEFKGHVSAPITAIDMAIKALDQSQWIPCSERLPDYRKTVIVSTYWGVTVAYRDAVEEDGTDDYWCLPLRVSDTSQKYIYAWMPMPEPYNESNRR